MVSPLRVVAWECGECATTNEGSVDTPASTAMLIMYEILAGSAPTATAQTIYLSQTEQLNIIWLATQTQARVAVLPCPIIIIGHKIHQCLVGTLVDVLLN